MSLRVSRFSKVLDKTIASLEQLGGSSKGREYVIATLEKGLQEFEGLEPFSFVDNTTTLQTLQIDFQPLALEAKDLPTKSGNFFKPWSVSDMKKHEKNMESERVKKDLPPLELTLKA